MNKTKTAMITVCGRPNVGKSSLTNALVGEKIAIVSNKPQTTRNRIYGVVNRGDTQYVLLDTPGFHKARNRLGDYMVKVTRESIADVDAVLLLVEPVAHVGIPEAELIEKIKASHLPAILCINKIDTVEKKDDLLAVIAAYSEAYPFAAIIPISARTHEGDKVAALGLGADDYIETPYGLSELLARIRERFQCSDDMVQTEMYSFGNTVFNYTTNEIRTGNNKTLITSRQAEILRMLAKNVNVSVDRDSLLNKVWGASSYANSLALNVQISYLRRALRNDNTVKIDSLMRKGYMLREDS